MAKKGEQDSSAMIIKALEDVSRRLSATNELLYGLGARMAAGGRTSVEFGAERFARPRFEVEHALAGGRPAVAAEDEAVLRDLAATHGLEAPMQRLIDVRNEKYPESRPRYWGIVNFDLHSANPRLFVFDVVARTGTPYLCAHGRGSEGPSDDGYANVFSNVPGSEATSVGVYRCAETYVSDDNGYSMRLDGLEPTNSNARARLIVMHGARYVSDEFVEQTGRCGRSQGCPAVDLAHVRTVIDQLKHGSLLNHWRS